MTMVDVSIIQKGSDIKYVFVENERYAKDLIDSLNAKASQEDDWLRYNITNIRVYPHKLNRESNKISIITKFDEPLFVDINDEMQSEITYKALWEDKNIDDGTFRLITVEESLVGGLSHAN